MAAGTGRLGPGRVAPAGRWVPSGDATPDHLHDRLRPGRPGRLPGVMFGICPDANILDISHQVPRYAIREGAWTLLFALPYMPVGIHVAVVDPGVGTERLAVALRTGRGDVLVGPDNGLLVPAGEALGGIVEARALENRDLMLPVVSASFHGRDVFAPMAAHLAAGVAVRGGRAERARRGPRPAAGPALRRSETACSNRSSSTSWSSATSRSPACRPTSRRRSGRSTPGPAARRRIPGPRRRPGGRGADGLGADLRAGARRLVAADGRLGGQPRARRQPGRRRQAARAVRRPPGSHPARLIGRPGSG